MHSLPLVGPWSISASLSAAPSGFSTQRRTGIARLSLAAAVGLACGSAMAQSAWTHLGGDPARTSSVVSSIPALQPAWLCSLDLSGSPITFNTGTSPVVLGDLVFALGFSSDTDSLYAIDRANGSVRWSVPVPTPTFGSTSSPAIHEATGIVIVAAGSQVRAFHAATGALAWSYTLAKDIVNASPVVTVDLDPADRLFITDYDGFGSDGTLYCINVSPFIASSNPFLPGQLVWSVDLDASTYGSTPSCSNGIVYVSDSGSFGVVPGSLRAFNATSQTTPSELWRLMAPGTEAFSGGLAIVDDPQGKALFAATYNFSGGLLNSTLLKIDAVIGTQLWSTPSNRSNSIPIALGDGRIALSAGVEGFGSVPSLQLFQDNGTSATLLWDSALATFNDLNSNSVIDPGEYTPLGGYTLQPVAVHGLGSPRLIVGTLGPSATDSLRVVDLSATPTQPGFVEDFFALAGESAALAGRVLYSFGADGLFAFGSFTCPADFTGDGFVDDADFVLFAQAYENFIDPAADLTGGGFTDDSDFVIFAAAYETFACP